MQLEAVLARFDPERDAIAVNRRACHTIRAGREAHPAPHAFPLMAASSSVHSDRDLVRLPKINGL